MVKKNMLITRREFLKAASVTAVGGILAACARSPQSGAPATSSAASGSPQYKLDLGAYRGPELTSQKVNLRFLRQIATPAAEDYYKDVYAQWAEAYPNITIQEETVPYGDLVTKIQTYVAAGDPPDIMMGKGDFVQSYVYNDIALNLSDYLAQEFVDDLTVAAKGLLVVNGKLYAWPQESSQIMVYFNKDIWEQAGVEFPPETSNLAEAWTWQQFEDAWKRISVTLNKNSEEPNIYPLAASTYGNGGPGSNYFYEGIYIRSMGDSEAAPDSSLYKTFIGISDDGLTASGYVNTPEAIEGMRFYQNIFKQKLTPSTAVPRQFEDGKAAMGFGPYSFSRRYRDANQPDWYLKFNWGATPVPKGNISFNHISGDSPFISAASKYPAEAVALMAFLNNDTNRVAWSKAWGAMPARRSLFEKMGYTEPVDELGVALIEGGYSQPITPGFTEYFSAMNTAIKDIALGADVESRLNKVAVEIDDYLTAYK